MVLYTLFSKSTELILDLTVFTGRKLCSIIYSLLYPEVDPELALLNKIDAELKALRLLSEKNGQMIEMMQLKQNNKNQAIQQALTNEIKSVEQASIEEKESRSAETERQPFMNLPTNEI